jgi:citrate synthase
MLDDLAVCIIAADPRIWPLKVVRLASAFGGLVSGLCAGLLATDGSTIGPISLSHSARFVCSIASEVGSSISPPAVEAAVGRRLAAPDFRFPGFGVPFREQDERVGAVGTCVASRGRAEGYHWRLVSAMSAVLAERKKLPMNVAGAAGAVLLDLGFDADQIDPISLALFFPNHFANAVEGAEQAPVLLQRLPADAVRYDGPEPRPSPRARGDD